MQGDQQVLNLILPTPPASERGTSYLDRLRVVGFECGSLSTSVCSYPFL